MFFCSKSYRYFHNLSYCMCQVKYFVMLLIVRFRYICMLVLATMRCVLFLMEIYASLSKLQLNPSAKEPLQLCFSHCWFINLCTNVIPKVWSEGHKCWLKKTESPEGASCGLFPPLLLANSPGSGGINFQSLGKISCMCVSPVPEGLAPELVQTVHHYHSSYYFGSGKGAKV